MLVILGNQLFPIDALPDASDTPVFMAEDMELCTYEKHHQQKIVLFLAAMRAYADELRDAGYDVRYHELDPDTSESYEDRLASAVDKAGADTLVHFEIEDKAMEKRIVAFADDHELERTELESPMFTCSRSAFADFAADNKRLLMGDFYRGRRKKLGILVDDDGEPTGGQWSFDEDNRKKLPAKVSPPEIPWPDPADHVEEVIELVEETFGDHPGDAAGFRWPTTREQAQDWLDDFLANRLADFGPYEDAFTTRSKTVFHSLLSPYLNMGLLTPKAVVEAVLEHEGNAPLQSIEGFVRQVIGWREFIRGIYREFGDEQEDKNFFGHERGLTKAWYTGDTGIPPLDDTIRANLELGWTHHIPRLMVLGNLMTLCEIRPSAAHRWFMEMFVDSSEWVMGPNVYGMALFSDGGLFATKPYICGSNYLRKMSDYGKGDWCDTVDGLYWRFIDKHRDFFAGNPRLALMPKSLDRLDDERRKHIFSAAEDFLAEFTAK
ncbi:MAG: cryptochrome/photolyase family protein [Woeseiaceae bacterium]|nr:cryptochrome/photolyase family protein [Woeseiaceae bacterium]